MPQLNKIEQPYDSMDRLQDRTTFPNDSTTTTSRQTNAELIFASKIQLSERTKKNSDKNQNQEEQT